MVVFREFRFEAAHRLVNVPPEHKCARMHGHSYKVRVFVRGAVDPKIGWVMDFADLRAVVDPVIAELDHRYLNDIPGLEISTAEMVTKWIWARLKPALPGLVKLELFETAKCGCVYEGE